MPDLFHRIRWTNVARAAALLLAVGLALAWPRLRAHDETLPPAAAEPVTVAEGPAPGDAEDVALGEEDALTRHAPAAHRAAPRKAATRRAVRHATAKRARQRRRTVARRRRVIRPAGGMAATTTAVPLSPRFSPGAEFRP